MNRIKRKLNSQRGASITYALLIFLVCAVVGSAVLVAGTTAAGRMSKVAENDQRYYAVKSAARLLIKEIDSKPVTIVKEVNGGTTKYYEDTIAPENLLDPNTTPLDSIPLWTAYQLMSSASNPPFSFSFDFTAEDAVGGGGTNISELAVDISENIENSPYGKMTIDIKQNSGTPSRTYTMKLLFNLDKSEIVDSGPTRTVTTGTYTWHLRDIQVSGSGVARG